MIEIGELDVGGIGGLEVLAVELTHVGHHILVDGFVTEEDFEVASLESFEIRTAFD